MGRERLGSHNTICAFEITAICVVVLAMLLCVLLCPVKVLANDKAVAYSYKDDGSGTTQTVNYYSIDEALQAGYEGSTIIMADDWNITEQISIPKNKTIIIDMNGNTIARASGRGQVIHIDEGSNVTFMAQDSASRDFSYKGYVKDGSTEYENAHCGGLITGGNFYYKNTAETGGTGGISMEANCTLTLTNVAVAGNSGSLGGGIRTAGDNCTINLTNALIEHNACTWPGTNSESGGIFGGGAIAICGEESYLYMDNSSASYNYSTDKGGGIYCGADAIRIYVDNGSKISENTAKHDGGGIYYGYSFFHLESRDNTGSISNNSSFVGYKDEGHYLTRHFRGGGGIYVNEKDLHQNEGTIKGLTINGNHTAVEGGGICLTQEWTRVINCTINGNTTDLRGGGVFVGEDDCSIEGCTIRYNACNLDGDNKEGGGVFVDSDVDIKLSGVCIIKSNTRGKNGSSDDLFLDDGAAHAYILGGVDEGSSVGVRTGITSDQRIGKNITTYYASTYFIDLDGYYVSHGTDEGGDLWQRHRSLDYLLQVNGVGTTTYKWNDTAVVNFSTSRSSDEVFWYWDTSATTGLTPVEDYITSKNMYDSTLSFAMPQNDVNLAVCLADRVTAMCLDIEAPVGGEALPETATLFRTDSGVGAEMELTIPITWYEVDELGNKTLATGNAGYNKTYEATANVSQQPQIGLFFSRNIAAKDVVVRTGSDPSSDVAASAASVDTTSETLSITAKRYKTALAEATSVKAASISVSPGTSEADLIALLPKTASVTLANGDSITLMTRQYTSAFPAGLIGGDSCVADPGSETKTYTVNLSLATAGTVNPATCPDLVVSINVLPCENVATPVLSPNTGQYDAFNGDVRLNDSRELKITASCATKDADIKYRFDTDPDDYVRSYNDKTGIVITVGENDQVLRTVYVWAQKTVNGKVVTSEVDWEEYFLDDTINKTIEINCADASPYSTTAGALSTSFEVTADLNATVKVSAPTQSGRTFDHWEWDGVPEGTDLTQQTLTIKRFSPTYSGKITAVYAPVVTSVDVDLAESEAHSTLTAKADYVKAGVAAGTTCDITSLFADDATVSWSPSPSADGTAAHLTAYEASIALADDANLPTGLIGLKLNGANTSALACVAANADGKKTLVVSFPATATYKATSVEQPVVDISFDEALGCQNGDAAGWGLPETVQVKCSCGGTENVSVEWSNATGFNKKKLEAQTLTATGTLVYPSGVDTTDAPTSVTATINVAAPETVDTPTASVAPGTYKSAQQVELSCDTKGATIYYTTDGTTPVNPTSAYDVDAYVANVYSTAFVGTSKVYDGTPIEVSESTTIKAIACRNGMIDSEVASFEYKIEPDTSYTVTFDSAGGSAVDAQTVAAGEVATEPVAPVLEGFTFMYWTDADGNKYDFSTPVTGDITLHAQWSANGEPALDGNSGDGTAGGSDGTDGASGASTLPTTGDSALLSVAIAALAAILGAAVIAVVAALVARRRRRAL